jgi:long-chain acyl-CoA synthetase
VPDGAALTRWAGPPLAATGSLLEEPRVTALIRAEIDRCSAGWKGFERIERFVLVPEDFTTDNGLLTPTLKLKRRVACQRYGSQIDAMYEERR